MQTEQTDSALPELAEVDEDGFVDCTFKIEHLRSDADHYYFRMSALHQGEVVGLDARLVKRIGPGFDAEMNLLQEHVYGEGLVLSSIGAASDRLIGALAKLYAIEPFDRVAAASESYTLIALQQEDTELETHAVRAKIFGRDQDEAALDEDYCESFFHIDLPNGYVHWNEKDADYREPLLRAWNGPSTARTERDRSSP
ncbi:hypothetical protein GLA29479_287 [Lysobacter antibioticus]|uniref:hypothetical protein n=1 Tax=Lysobacter antibioticus TaxID=84531 RepID=UPI000721E1CC|nr:hypothetical protein [Lysobacter antibioticus]ALN61172.1 hypothetical protein GLA29479_287 [Lysobacter antibioticus]